MPRTNSRAKKMARERQSRTGEPYARVRRLTLDSPSPAFPDGQEMDWQAQVGPGDVLDHFVINEDGSTHGRADLGIILGLTSDRGSARIEHHWEDARRDLHPLLGAHLISRSRFTNAVSVIEAPLTFAVPSRDRRLRSLTYGGYQQSLDPSQEPGDLIRRRNLSLRVEHETALSPDYRVHLVVRGDEGEATYRLDRVGRMINGAGRCIGIIDYFTDAPGSVRQEVGWLDFRARPLIASPRLRGLHPIVWASERERIEVGRVVQVVTAVGI